MFAWDFVSFLLYNLSSFIRTFLGLSLAAFEKPTKLLNKRLSRLENFILVLVFVWFSYNNLHYLASEILGDHGNTW